MFCSKCGNQMADDSVFCPKCGNKVGGATTASATVEEKVVIKSKKPLYRQAFGKEYIRPGFLGV